MVARPMDRAVEGLARRQHGAFHRRQVLQLGFSSSSIRHRLRTGTWVSLADSAVYALPSHPGTWLRQCMAATLWVPDGAVTGATAAALHGLPGFPRAHIEVVTPRRSPPPSPFGRVRHSTRTMRRILVHGVPSVAPADCLVQLAARLDPARLAAVVDDGAASGIVDLDELRAAARPGVPGAPRLRQVLDERADGWVPPSSVLERYLRAVLFTTPELPGVMWEAPAPWWERGEGRVDALVPAWWLIVEADGRRWHSRVRDFERDRWRDNQAAAHGYAVLRFTWSHLRDDLAGCRDLVVECGRRRRVEAA